MITIAGGIILAVFVLAFFREILSVLVALLVLGLGLGAVLLFVGIMFALLSPAR